MLVSSSVYSVAVPLVDAMTRNVALEAHGGRAESLYSQGHFEVAKCIDGVAGGGEPDNGWAYYGRLEEAEAMFVFSSASRVRRVELVSGAGRSDHHLTHFMLAYSTAADPQLLDHDSWHSLPVAVDPAHEPARPPHVPQQVRVVEQGRVMAVPGLTHVHLECDYVAATALKLVVLGTDAENNNAIVNEVLVWAV